MLAPFGMLRTLKVKESLSEAVTFTNATSPRVTSIHLATYVNFGGKLSAKKNGINDLTFIPNWTKEVGRYGKPELKDKRSCCLDTNHF